MSEELNLYIVEAVIGEEPRLLGTFLSDSFVFEHGITSEVIVGEFSKSETGEIEFEKEFKANSLFKQTIFKFVASEMVNDPEISRIAKEQENGWVYVIDQRTPTPEGEVPPFDIIGAFQVVDSCLKEFSPNNSYQIRSRNGFVNFGRSNNAIFKVFIENLVLKNA